MFLPQPTQFSIYTYNVQQRLWPKIASPSIFLEDLNIFLNKLIFLAILESIIIIRSVFLSNFETQIKRICHISTEHNWFFVGVVVLSSDSISSDGNTNGINCSISIFVLAMQKLQMNEIHMTVISFLLNTNVQT